MNKFARLATLAILFGLAPRESSAIGPIISRSIASQSSCTLFQDGAQDPALAPDFKIEAYEPVHDFCYDLEGTGIIALRKFSAHGEHYLLGVEPQSLETVILRTRCLTCVPADQTSLQTMLQATRYQQALERFAAAPHPLQNDGLISAEEPAQGAFVTVDLCPSRKALDRGIFDILQSLGNRTPIAIAASGRWIQNHSADFVWLKERAAKGDLRMTWVNHSHTHPFVDGVANSENFLLRPGVDVRHEILEAERVMIAAGVTPSVFFRAPGLISNEKLVSELKALGLILLGADAWLAKGEKAKDGSIILVHANGNDPLGLKLLLKLIGFGRLPLPLLPLNSAPARH